FTPPWPLPFRWTVSVHVVPLQGVAVAAAKGADEGVVEATASVPPATTDNSTSESKKRRIRIPFHCHGGVLERVSTRFGRVPSARPYTHARGIEPPGLPIEGGVRLRRRAHQVHEAGWTGDDALDRAAVERPLHARRCERDLLGLFAREIGRDLDAVADLPVDLDDERDALLSGELGVERRPPG